MGKLEKTASGSRDDFAAHYEKARELLGQDACQDALKSCEKAIKADPGSPDGHYLKGRILETLRMPKETPE